MEYTTFIEQLKERLKRPLPGKDAQLELASKSRLRSLLKIKPPPFAKKSAILILFYSSGNEVFTILIQRPDYGGVHGGQISFPGGKKEKEDRDIVDTALRETHEEIGIETDHIEILGLLTDLYIFPSNHLVYPVLGCTTSPLSFRPDEREVSRILEIPLSALFDEINLKQSEMLEVRGMPFEAPGFRIGTSYIWGATAMIINELKVMMA